MLFQMQLVRSFGKFIKTAATIYIFFSFESERVKILLQRRRKAAIVRVQSQAITFLPCFSNYMDALLLFYKKLAIARLFCVEA